MLAEGATQLAVTDGGPHVLGTVALDTITQLIAPPHVSERT
jgi:hypothetical protein